MDLDLVDNREALRSMIRNNIISLINDNSKVYKKTKQKPDKIDAQSNKFFLTQITEK
jgi:hypothetical protein